MLSKKQPVRKVEKKSKISLENKQTQTEVEELYEQQLIELQQQLVLLETENRALKNSINGQYSQNSLPSLNTLPSLDSSVKNQRKCNCKGKCATRSCGCVKNQQSCGQLCKCSKKMCKNHPRIKDKENLSIHSPSKNLKTPSQKSLIAVKKEAAIKTENITPKEANSTNDRLDDINNFMKPKHELPRTPPDQNSMKNVENYNTYESPLSSSSFRLTTLQKRPSVSDIILPVPFDLNTDSDEIAEDLLHDLSTPTVDWNDHKSKLVKCKKCRRLFWPHRVEKHEACCQGV